MRITIFRCQERSHLFAVEEWRPSKPSDMVSDDHPECPLCALEQLGRALDEARERASIAETKMHRRRMLDKVAQEKLRKALSSIAKGCVDPPVAEENRLVLAMYTARMALEQDDDSER